MAEERTSDPWKKGGNFHRDRGRGFGPGLLFRSRGAGSGVENCVVRLAYRVFGGAPESSSGHFLLVFVVVCNFILYELTLYFNILPKKFEALHRHHEFDILPPASHLGRGFVLAGHCMAFWIAL
jgi:hypothetical protein